MFMEHLKKIIGRIGFHVLSIVAGFGLTLGTVAAQDLAMLLLSLLSWYFGLILLIPMPHGDIKKPEFCT